MFIVKILSFIYKIYAKLSCFFARAAPWIVIIFTLVIAAYMAFVGAMSLLNTDPVFGKLIIVLFIACVVLDILIYIAESPKKKNKADKGEDKYCQ